MNHDIWSLIRRLSRLADSAWFRGDFSSYEYFSSCVETLLRDVE